VVSFWLNLNYSPCKVFKFKLSLSLSQYVWVWIQEYFQSIICRFMVWHYVRLNKVSMLSETVQLHMRRYHPRVWHWYDRLGCTPVVVCPCFDQGQSWLKAQLYQCFDQGQGQLKAFSAVWSNWPGWNILFIPCMLAAFLSSVDNWNLIIMSLAHQNKL